AARGQLEQVAAVDRRMVGRAAGHDHHAGMRSEARRVAGDQLPQDRGLLVHLGAHRLSRHRAGYRSASVIPLRDNIPTARKPVVTYAIIIANVLVYFLWQRGGLSWGSPS